MRSFFQICAVGLALLCTTNVRAELLVEDFNAEFPAWESGWLGMNTNLKNYYETYREGNNTTRGLNTWGLYISDGIADYSNICDIEFSSEFGVTLTSFSIQIGTDLDDVSLLIFDRDDIVVYDKPVYTSGITPSWQTLALHSVSGLNGISKFRLISGGDFQIEGATAIDNVMANRVPEPSTIAMFSTFCLIGGVLYWRKRRRS